ncbi:Putative Rab-GTPase-TBC domain-containing protein [Septoria linicola]|uniref:Rab-GTPase-TBC domain-containing protein n=1 Tax=Septoria linicola TaxID=215465 RepID=A0A9Q9ENW5_9PEZI|nr:Putative Rab-GTPase-TBC domain-containing protein [Septoria linicola]
MDIWAFIDRTDTGSPFWRSNSATSNRSHSNSNSNTTAQPSRQNSDTPEPTRKVIGASYSHADVLNFNQLSVSGSDRPRTPPTDPRNSRNTPSPGNTRSPPARPKYSSFLSESSNAYEEEEGDAFGLDDDEDEFGLPSIASMRRKDKRLSKAKATDPGGGFGNTGRGSSKQFGDTLNRNNAPSSSAAWAIDNGDMSEMRTQIPAYPSLKKSTEGQKILRPQYKEILRDPANSLHLISHPSLPANASGKEAEAHSARTTRINKFKRILQSSSVNLPELRDSAWSGLPSEVRAMTWQLLLGYLPTSSERRVATLERKRKEYLDGVRQAFERGDKLPDTSSTASPRAARSRGLDEAIWHQISIDVPRTNPHLELYSYEATQRSLERILYVWAIRHPASGYVQGINDLVTPFWQVFLGQYITDPEVDSGMDPGQLPKAVLDAVEADSFWCLTKLLDGIQDNYIHAQPGIQRQVAQLRDLTARIDGGLAKHMEQEGIEFIQFSFRWMNCLLMREISVRNTIRMWDTYLAEDQGFSAFHLYVCAAFLVKWSDKLQRMDFQEIMMFLQSLPTKDWTEKDIELLLSEAFIWKSLFAGSKAHVRQGSQGLPSLQL